MSLTIDTTPEIEAQLREEAMRNGMDVNQYMLMLVQKTLTSGARPRRKPEDLTPEERAAARARLKRHFGRGHSGDRNAADNDRIDADLAHEYANTHEDKA